MNREDAISKLEYWRDQQRSATVSKWDTMPLDKWQRIYKRARSVSTKNLIMMCTNEKGIRPEFRRSPWLGVLAERIANMKESEIDEAEIRACAVELADDPTLIKR